MFWAITLIFPLEDAFEKAFFLFVSFVSFSIRPFSFAVNLLYYGTLLWQESGLRGNYK
jgi:hypothetical protein